MCWGNVDPMSAVQTLPSGTRQIASGSLGEPCARAVVDVPLGSATSTPDVFAEGARLWILTVVMQSTKTRFDERSAFLDAFVR